MNKPKRNSRDGMPEISRYNLDPQNIFIGEFRGVFEGEPQRKRRLKEIIKELKNL